MSTYVPSVEDRLRLVSAYLEIMARIARLVHTPVPEGFSHFVDPEDFAQWVARIADIARASLADALVALTAPSEGKTR